MTVRQLIDILEGQDPDARVLIMSQIQWPFEHLVDGVAVRSELYDVDGKTDHTEPAMAASDVFLVEGHQLRYGNSAAWRVARR